MNAAERKGQLNGLQECVNQQHSGVQLYIFYHVQCRFKIYKECFIYRVQLGGDKAT